MPDTITILHLSDIQFGRNHRFGRLAEQDESGIVLDTLLDRLLPEFDLFEGYDIRPDIIIISGDLAETGARSEFADAADFLARISIKLNIPRNRIIIIPGNHDINRKHCE